MAKKSLRASLNQIRIWVRQGRTDAWIAHQLEVPTAQLRDFKRQHELEEAGAEEEPAELELRDEIEAEVEAASQAEPEEEAEEEPEEPEQEPEREAAEAGAEEAEPKPAAHESEPQEGEEAKEDEERPRRRRRRRRRRRGGRRALEAVFDHGDRDGYGLWLDPAVKDDPVYAEHWAGQRELKVSIEADRIVLERAGGEESGGENGD